MLVAAAMEGHSLQCPQEQVSAIPRGPVGHLGIILPRRPLCSGFQPTSYSCGVLSGGPLISLIPGVFMFWLEKHLIPLGVKNPQPMNALGLPCWREPSASGTTWRWGRSPREAEEHLASQRGSSSGGALSPQYPQARSPQR